MVKKVPASQENEKTTKSANSSEARSGELENLREILFGNQVRATEDRLNQLEEGLQTMQHSLTETLNTQNAALTETLNKQNAAMKEATVAAEKELAAQISSQATLAKANHQALEESNNRLHADIKRQIEEIQTAVSQELDALRDSITSQMRQMQSESQQRDDDLRQELLSVSSSLDGKLTPRQDLGQMLMELAQRLQSGAASQADAPQNK